MITNHLLEAKYRAQRRLAEEAGYDLQKYSDNAHQRVLQVEQEYRIKFTYAEPKPQARKDELTVHSDTDPGTAD